LLFFYPFILARTAHIEELAAIIPHARDKYLGDLRDLCGMRWTFYLILATVYKGKLK